MNNFSPDMFLFFISLVGALVLVALALAALINPKFVFWPPPHKGSWQDRLFIWLFRAMVYPLIALSLYTFTQGKTEIWQMVLGALMLVAGFGTAFASTLNLGWKNAFGDKEGLVTNGWFAYSRNPVYLVSWFGMIGWAILADSYQVTIILALWAFLYLCAIFLEERWLLEVYGEAFEDYRKKVPRYL